MRVRAVGSAKFGARGAEIFARTKKCILIYCKCLKYLKIAKTFLVNPWHWLRTSLERLGIGTRISLEAEKLSGGMPVDEFGSSGKRRSARLKWRRCESQLQLAAASAIRAAKTRSIPEALMANTPE